MSEPTEDTEILVRLTDAGRADQIREVLEDAGIVVSTPGLEHRSMWGVLGGFVDIVVRVPRKDLDRARAILTALDSGEVVRDDDTPDDDDEDDDLAREDAPDAVTYRESTRGTPKLRTTLHRSKRVAAFAGLSLMFGGAHLYARRYASAAGFALLMITSFVAIGSGVWLGLLLPVAIIALDIVGAGWHCDHSTTGIEPTWWSWRRYALQIGLAVVAFWWLAAPHAAALFAGRHAREICDVLSQCELTTYGACVQDLASRRLDHGHDQTLPACAACVVATESCDELGACPCGW